MKRILLALSAFAALFAQAKTVTLTVDSDTTLSAALTAAGETLSSGDTLVKKGSGKLTTDDTITSSDSLTVTISEGVLELAAAGQLGKDNDITVEDGATLLVDSSKDVAMLAMFFAIEVAHYGIIAFRGETLELPTPAVESKKKRKRLLQLAAIAVATS